MALTHRQQLILEVIRRHIREQGMPPTRTEIARLMGFRSTNGVEGHLRALERKGVISLRANASRGIQLIDDEPTEDEGLPLVGKVAAGAPILAQAHIEHRCRLDPALFHPRADYLLRVQGQSMRDAGILDGDLLAVHRQPQAENGAIVVARLDDEVTVKRLRREGGTIWLLPENPDFQPIVVDLSHQPLVIEGIGVGVLRRPL